MFKKSIPLACAFALAGCAAQTALHRVAVDYNDLVARTSNEVTLTNILRAKDRMPLHFTSITQLRGNVQMQASAELSSVLQGAKSTDNVFAGALDGAPATTNLGNIAEGVDTFTPKVSGSVTTNPNFDLQVLDTQEFYLGMISSVQPGTIAHYLNQNWSAELLTHLFVATFVITANGEQVIGGKTFKDGDEIFRIINDPNDAVEAPVFSNFVRCVRLRTVRRPQKAIELLSPSAVPAYHDLSLLDGQRFDVARDKQGNPEQPVRLVKIVPGGDALGLREVCAGKSTPWVQLTAQRLELTGLSLENQAMDASGLVNGKMTLGNQLVNVHVNSVIRSAEGLFYYLGEYLRGPIAQVRISEPEAVAHCPQDGPILTVVTRRPRHPLVAAKLNGITYYVPSREECNGRSTQVLALVQQLVNLQKKSAEKVATQTVRLVN